MSLNLTRRQVLAGASATFALSSLGAPAVAQSASYRLGWIAAVTGFGATNAQGQDWGFRMAVQDANEAGGINGRQLEIVMRDSASEPAKASGFAKELVFNEKVDVLCGPSNSGECLPTLGTVARANKLHLVGGSVEQLIDPVKYPMAFRYLNTSNQWIKAAVKAMAVDMKFKRIAIINDNTPYGPLARDAVVMFMKYYGLEPVYSALVDVNKPDLTDELIKARDAGAEVVTEWSVASGFIGRLLNARGEQKWNVPVVGHPNILQTQVASLLSKPEYWDNAYGVGYTHLLVDAQGNLPPKVSALLDKHRDSVGPFLGAGISALLQGHSAATLYLAGLKATGGDTDSAKLKAALESLPSVEPPLGIFKFSADNHNGFADENMLLVAAREQKPNGGYPKVQFQG